MHYPLGITMTPKKDTNGAVIGQRKGLSQVSRNTKAIFKLSTFYVKNFQDHVQLKKKKYLTRFSC
jgi:hypothetical protein